MLFQVISSSQDPFEVDIVFFLIELHILIEGMCLSEAEETQT